ncbi:MAG TPA: hypothetical protein VMC78_17110 [Mycobacterium sp.]|nr:hypothetical protein [Mycobacterium sp.]
MSSSQAAETRTRMFARVLGPYYAIVSIVGLVHAPKTTPILTDFHVWPWDTGAPILVGGLIIVALHPHWTSLAAVIVTVMGWLDTLRGFALLAFPGNFMSFAHWLTGPGVQQIVYICLIVIGLYLTYVGWKPEPSRSASQGASSTPDLPRAA